MLWDFESISDFILHWISSGNTYIDEVQNYSGWNNELEIILKNVSYPLVNAMSWEMSDYTLHI